MESSQENDISLPPNAFWETRFLDAFTKALEQNGRKLRFYNTDYCQKTMSLCDDATDYEIYRAILLAETKPEEWKWLQSLIISTFKKRLSKVSLPESVEQDETELLPDEGATDCQMYHAMTQVDDMVNGWEELRSLFMSNLRARLLKAAREAWNVYSQRSKGPKKSRGIFRHD
jgi:hypothetical protein